MWPGASLLREIFANVCCRKNGMSALMKYWNDPKTLAKIGERMGPVAANAAAAPTAPGSRGSQHARD